MKVTLHRQDDDFNLVATSAAGHTVAADGSADIGGHDAAMRPMEMLLSSVGACSSIDVILLLRKQRQDLRDIRIEVTGQRREEVPKVFTDIHVAYTLYGEVDAKKAERACRLSMEKLCSVSMMLKAGGVKFTWSCVVEP